MKKLYRATVEFEFFVVAEDEDDAYRSARRYAEDAMDDNDTHIWTSEVTDIAEVPKVWRDSYPFGNDDVERTCAVILSQATV